MWERWDSNPLHGCLTRAGQVVEATIALLAPACGVVSLAKRVVSVTIKVVSVTMPLQMSHSGRVFSAKSKPEPVPETRFSPNHHQKGYKVISIYGLERLFFEGLYFPGQGLTRTPTS